MTQFFVKKGRLFSSYFQVIFRPDVTNLYFRRFYFCQFFIRSFKLLFKMPTHTRNNNQEDENQNQPRNHGPFTVPSFSPASAASWFVVLEAQFNMRGITDEASRFQQAISSIPVDLIDQVPAAVLTGSDYTALKNHIVEHYERSKPELYATLIAQKSLDNRRPSVYLREIAQLATKVGVPEDLARLQFLQSLDPQISTVLSTQKDLPLANLGKLADELLYTFVQTSRNQPHSYETNSTPRQSVEPPLRGRTFTSNQNQGKFRNRSPSPNGGAGVQPFAVGQRPRVCRFHIYYGSNARSCMRWCNWPGQKPPIRDRSQSRGPNRRNTSPTPNTQKDNNQKQEN